jgi:hypothetical protein
MPRDRSDRFENENTLLLAACRVGTGTPTLVLSSPLDWAYVLRAADRQGVTPLLHDWLMRHREVAVDPASAQRVRDAYWASHFQNTLLLAELARVSHAAAQAGIDLMPLKGATLASDYYPNPALRPLSDLDLLIRPGDVDGLGRVLQALNYQEVAPPPSYVDDRWLDSDSRDHCWFASREGFNALIEYRTTPLELAVGRLTDLDPACTASLRQHAAEVWARARPARDRTALGACMAPEDLLLHVTTHLAAKHLDFRLIWLHDVARIVMGARELDWAYVSRTTARLRIAAPVSAALQAAVRWVGAPIPPENLERVWGEMRTRSVMDLERRDHERLCAHVASLGGRDLTAEGPAVWPLVAALSRVKGWRPRLRVLRWVALPGRAYLAHRGAAPTPGPLGYLEAWARRGAGRLARRPATASGTAPGQSPARKSR